MYILKVESREQMINCFFLNLHHIHPRFIYHLLPADVRLELVEYRLLLGFVLEIIGFFLIHIHKL